MESYLAELSRSSLIKLIFNKLLNKNQDCIKKLIIILNKVELSDARNYHIDRFNYKTNIFSTYSFLCSLKGYIIYGKTEKTKISKKRGIHEVYYKNCIPQYYDIINKYNKLLEYNLNYTQRKILLKMKDNRLQRFDL